MKKNFLLNKTTILAVSAVALLGFSAVGSTRAAIIADTNDIIMANFRTSNVAVTLFENGEPINNVESTEKTSLLSGITDFHIGETYDEVVSFTNEGDYDAYARVIITKSWYDGEKKNWTLNPKLIDLTIADPDAWIIDETARTSERTVYYYKNPITAGDSVDVTSKLTVNNVITEIVTKSAVKDAPEGTIQTTYNYNGMSFSIEVQVDEIQTHNAYDAARASWGVYLDIDENGIIQSVSQEEISENTTVEENTLETEGQTNEN